MSINFSADLPPCPDVALNCFASGSDLCVTITAQERATRSPSHFILVLDISGSMNSEASLPNPNANPDEAQVTSHPPRPHSLHVALFRLIISPPPAPPWLEGHILAFGPRQALIKSYHRGASFPRPASPLLFFQPSHLMHRF
jgi:hypothetical protein